LPPENALEAVGEPERYGPGRAVAHRLAVQANDRHEQDRRGGDEDLVGGSKIAQREGADRERHAELPADLTDDPGADPLEDALVGRRRRHGSVVDGEQGAHGALVHEPVFLRYFMAGHDDTPEAVRANSCRGIWLHGPGSTEYQNLGGYPPDILGAVLSNLFQRGFSVDPDTRPLLPEWRDALLHALKNIFPCPRCHKPLIADYSQVRCPYCTKPFPTLKIVAPSGRQIVINSAEVAVGRAELGGSKTISRQHVIFHKLGPDVYVQSVGKAGTWRLNGHGWKLVENYVRVPLEDGQSLRMGDIEVQLVACEMDGQTFKP